MSEYQFGRRQPKNAPALRFGLFRDALVIPEHPAQYNSIANIGGWQILGNDRYGDCVAVTWATIRRIITTLDDNNGVYPGIDQVLEFYRTQNPNFDPNGSPSTNGPGSRSDGGMDIQTALEYLVNTGGPDGVKALAFAKVDHTNVEEVRAALAVFDFLWIGLNVTDQNEREFPNTPWSMNGSVLGGHSVTGTGYDPSKFIMETWAHQSYLATDFVQNGSGSGPGVEEAWIVIWPEHAQRLGVDARSAIDSAYYGLTGRHITWPTPPLPPTPVSDVDANLTSALKRFLASRSVPLYLRNAATAWLNK